MAEQAEIVSAAVPTAADSFTAVGTIRAPAGMKRIKKAFFIYTVDAGAAGNTIRFAPVFRLQGSGLLEQSPHDYLGMFGGHFDDTDEGSEHHDAYMEYDVNIPISTGGDIQCSVNALDEVTTAGTAQVCLIFDDIEPSQGNSMADYVDVAGTTTAGAFAAVGTLIVPEGKEGAAPKKIKKLIIGIGEDQGGADYSLRCASQIRISGSGLVDPGLHVYPGPQGSGAIVVTGGAYINHRTMEIDVDLTVNPSGEIDIEHQFITETPTASTVAVGVLYE